MPSQNQDNFTAAASGKPSSQAQIDALNAMRPKLEVAREYTPMGSFVNEIKRRKMLERNQAIDKQIEFQKRRMKRQKNRAKEALNKSADRRQTQRRQNDRER